MINVGDMVKVSSSQWPITQEALGFVTSCNDLDVRFIVIATRPFDDNNRVMQVQPIDCCVSRRVSTVSVVLKSAHVVFDIDPTKGAIDYVVGMLKQGMEWTGG